MAAHPFESKSAVEEVPLSSALLSEPEFHEFLPEFHHLCCQNQTLMVSSERSLVEVLVDDPLSYHV